MPLATQILWKNGNMVIRDATVSPTNSLWDTCPLAAIRNDPSVGILLEDHFLWYTTAHGLSTIATDSGTALVSATSPYGILQLYGSDGSVTDNDEVYVGSTVTMFLPAAGKDIWFECKAMFTETNTDDANIILGLSSLYAANTLVDNGAGPPADYSGCVFYKVDGGTVWNCETSTDVGVGTQTTTTGIATRISGSYQRFGFHMTSNQRVDYFIDGVCVATHPSTNISTTAMGLLFGVKTGDTTAGSEQLNIDSYRVAQLA